MEASSSASEFAWARCASGQKGETMADRLIVPLDGSELGEAALPWAAYLGRTQNLKLVLTQVVPWPIYPATDGLGGYLPGEVYDEVLEESRQEATDYLGGVRERLERDGLKAEVVVREGMPAENLLDLADELGAYAIAMSTHGRGGLARFVLGSVAERVIQQATVPVLLVRARETPMTDTPRSNRLLIPLDGSPLAERALDLARELDGAATLVLTRVVAPVTHFIPDAEGATTFVDTIGTRRVVDEAEAYLRQVEQSLQERGARTEVSVRRGAAASEIHAAAHELQADLIVMATHGRVGPGRWFLGSVADQVVRQADLPVLLVSARALAARAAGPFTVRDLMTRDLTTVLADEPLSSALRKLLRRQVSGSPVLGEGGELVGVITEYDLLSWQARLAGQEDDQAPLGPEDYARRLERTTVGEVMSKPAISIEESAPLSEVLKVLMKRGVRRLPVTRDGRLVGIIARADALRAMAALAESRETVRARRGAPEP
jgi:nucleotide-binding universal stress UspA family protein/predicted transcriptional regulator